MITLLDGWRFDSAIAEKLNERLINMTKAKSKHVRRVFEISKDHDDWIGEMANFIGITKSEFINEITAAAKNGLFSGGSK